MSSLLDSSQFWLARWVLPVSSPPVENACLVVDENKVVAVISRKEYDSLPEKVRVSRSRDLGEAIILPGLINLHTHLDYSALKHLDNYAPFFQWIPQLIKNSWQWDSGKWFQSALTGAYEILESGTSTVADASYSGAAARAVAASGLRGIVGLELFGLIEEEADKIFSEWLKKYERFLAESEPEVKKAISDGRLKITIAPHTPYTVCPALIRKALDWSKERHLPMFIHLAESVSEKRWLADEDKDLDKFLITFSKGSADFPWRKQGLSPVRHMEKYNLLDSHVVAAHLVQINESDIEALASHQVSAVHCPRSNSRLRNGVAPLPGLIKSGVRLGFGTDSAASVDDLNVLTEAQFAWNLHRAVNTEFSEKAEKAVYYLTLGAAGALNMQDSIGSFEAGKKCDFAVFSLDDLPEIARQKPYECLIYGGAKPKDLVIDGKHLLQNGYIAGETGRVRPRS